LPTQLYLSVNAPNEKLWKIFLDALLKMAGNDLTKV
jgi:wyosine [tRNA(Phe)-imidazoG37] synthetase (radical SAM superfamily)